MRLLRLAKATHLRQRKSYIKQHINVHVCTSFTGT